MLEELEKDGIRPERMAIEAFGEYSPKFSNATAAGRAMNRKVVIAISRYAMEAPKTENVPEGGFTSSKKDSTPEGSAGTADLDVVRGENNSIELNFSNK